MRSIILLMCFAVLVPFAYSQDQASMVGVQVGDMNRSIDPCTDFFEYANGNWRAENPIPASMSRWSRRWAAGEANKDNLKSILEEASQQKSPKGSIDQLIGDYYGACMDEAHINSLGMTPLKPLLDQIDKIQDVAGVQNMIITL